MSRNFPYLLNIHHSCKCKEIVQCPYKIKLYNIFLKLPFVTISWVKKQRTYRTFNWFYMYFKWTALVIIIISIYPEVIHLQRYWIYLNDFLSCLIAVWGASLRAVHRTGQPNCGSVTGYILCGHLLATT